MASIFQQEKAPATLADMANKEHLVKLQEGGKAWDAWRAQNPDIQLDLSDADLREVYLDGADLRRANLRRANLGGMDLRETNLGKADLREANLSQAFLCGVNLSQALLREANLSRAALDVVNFSEADLSGANLSQAYLTRAKLVGANLKRAKLSGVELDEADLREASLDETYLDGANLKRADLIEANFSGADLSRANLSGVNLSRAVLHGANLSEAILDGGNLIGADLSRANLSRADLSQANLSWVNLSWANLGRADLTHAQLGETIFVNIVLTKVKGLDSCKHIGPSAVDHRTLQRSDELPLVFLQGCGLPNTFIDYLPALLNQPIQHYSCFISYSSEDDAFAQRLHADLQDKGVRCWFAPEDLPWGRKILDEIDKAIRVHEKLLLILSKYAIDSEWVEDEVTKAYAEERRRKQTILFPIRIDKAVMETEEPWAVKLRDGRNIGDFSNWKNHNDYQKGLERLLRDLEIEKDAS